MYDILRKYIDRVTSAVITDEEFVYIEQAFDVRKVKRKQFLLHEGSVCRYMSFIASGAMRQYSIDNSGNEHITTLALEGWWISDRGSFYNVTPSRYNIDAVEDSTLLVANLERINLLKEQSLTFLKMAHILDQNHSIAAQKRIEASVSYSAEEKYNYLVQAHPEFFNRFPQSMLASYLGLTPETMSRVRKQVLSR
ncbi:Crp/Fnr family transcriptional regulator [Dyadobacter sp. MSC1_007]|jgi:CRP-like cAMP-binding protein|uniref:Crp/Fnr family transcriptional regulator n=1 Tax=Dyadobacter sp. MSC1_007 TaxID=2909264 RepID=UPI00202DCC94|nr:Crp/Fnr family transcriptional regulator [Dyadobacter sp. MSC1_007]